MSFERGSEWRKWDLHMHTQSSFDYKNKSTTDLEIITALKKQNIEVVAITDHHLIDIDRITNLRKLAGNDVVILPGIEFCGDARGKEPIHFIGIFSEDSDLNYIWNEINSKSNIAKQRKEGKKEQEIYCNLKDTSKLIKKLGGIVSIHAGKKSNSIEKITNSLPVSMAQKEDIVKYIDIFELGKEDDQEGYKKKVFPKIGKYPMIICSDNHNAKNYKLKQSCWIKANPTFQGLKQIIYEPDDRVKIQELKPELKSTYALIDRVEYTDTNKQSKKVYFNQNLNSVIGSRAQGKSNLLKNIAFAVDPNQCRDRGIESNKFLGLDSFKVIWNDGKVMTLNEKESKEKGILFIPQRYLGELVYESNPQFYDFLVNLLENREDFQSSLDGYKKFENDNSLKIASLIKDILAITSSGKDKKEKLKKYGKKDDQRKELDEIEKSIKDYGKTSSLTQDELEKHEKLTSQKADLERKIVNIENDVSSFNILKEEEVISSEIIYELEFTKNTIQKIQKKLSDSEDEFKKVFIKEEVNFLTENKKSITKELIELNKKLKTLQDKVNKSKALTELTKKLGEKKEYFRQTEILEKQLDELKSDYDQKKRELIESYLQFENKYKELNVDFGNFDFSNVKLVIAFCETPFVKMIDNIFNYHNSINLKRDEKKRYENIKACFNNPIDWKYTKKDFAKLIEEILVGILRGDLLLKAGVSMESAIAEVFKNRFQINFLESITNKKGIIFPKMSDGEQMLVLLELIFKFDIYNYPIILDQPEDDLDSRAISKTIVDFVNTEKTRRQIIIASHNANLVVCGDSENILVSIKKGTREKPQFEYTGGAIEDRSINKEIVNILEGGPDALKKRMQKLNITNK